MLAQPQILVTRTSVEYGGVYSSRWAPAALVLEMKEACAEVRMIIDDPDTIMLDGDLEMDMDILISDADEEWMDIG